MTDKTWNYLLRDRLARRSTEVRLLRGVRLHARQQTRREAS